MNNERQVVYPGWRIVRKIGQGSYGIVYEIERKISGVIEKAALKHISIPQNDGEIRSMRQMGMDDASVTNMFEEQKESVLNEYLLMQNLGGHTNVVNCHDVSEIQHSDGMGWDIYIRMELLESMTAKLNAYPGEAETIQFGLDLCSALELCEKNKIIHRDIKPQNIFVSSNGDYKLGDFGIARTIESATHGASTIGIGSGDYMAPEVRYGNEKYNHTVDIYSLGLVMYWLMNEMRLPFCPLPPVPLKLSDVQNAQARRMCGEALPAPKHGSDGLKVIVLKACAFNPKERYQSATEMKQALESLIKMENENKTVGMWAAIEAERERKRKEAEEAERQRIENELKRLADEAAEKKRQRLLEEQRIRDEKAAELKRLKELEEKKKQQEKIKKILIPVLMISTIILVLGVAIGVWISSIKKEPEVVDVTPAPTVAVIQTVQPTPKESYENIPSEETFKSWMSGVSYEVVAPLDGTYLSEYQYGTVKTDYKQGVYGRSGAWSSSTMVTSEKIEHGAEVTVMAIQNGYMLVRVNSTGLVVWLGSSYVNIQDFSPNSES